HTPKSSQSDASTKSLTTREAEEDSLHLSDDDHDDLRNVSVEVVYEDYQMMTHQHASDDYGFYDDDDDEDYGIPL
ncbi:MAG: hypothetical protein SGILL_005008, partial [Bacillariaceae sp.]